VGVLYSGDSSSTAFITTTTYNGTGVGAWGFATGETAIVTNTSRSVAGSGWIPVNLGAISSGAPLGVWPVDPVNTGTTTQYIYAATTTSWKITANMESTKYKTNGAADVETNDGGNSVYVYEAGSNLAL
jgi:hypothetical protein